MNFASGIIWIIYVRAGGCRHIFYLSIDSLELALKTNWISQFFCVWAFVFGKVSVSLLMLRLGPRDKLRRWLLYFAAWSIVLTFGVQSILIFIQCRPTQALWKLDVNGRCWPTQVLADIAMALTGVLRFQKAIGSSALTRD